MTDYYVWSGATGAANGTSWEDSWTTALVDWSSRSVGAGDRVYIRQTHTEDAGAAANLDGPTTLNGDVLELVCVVGADTGTTPGNLATMQASSGKIETTNSTLDINGFLYCYGLFFEAEDDIRIAFDSDSMQLFEQCKFSNDVGINDNISLGGTDGTYRSAVFLDCEISNTSNANTHPIRLQGGDFVFRGGSLTGSTVSGLFESGANANGTVLMEGMDMSAGFASSPTLLTVGDITGEGKKHFRIRNCELPASTTLLSGTIADPETVYEVAMSRSGTSTDPEWERYKYDRHGTVRMVSDRYRSGSNYGDGVATNPRSMEIDVGEGTTRGYPFPACESFPIYGWTAGDGSTSYTYTVYIASDGTIQDDDVWLELLLPDDGSTGAQSVRLSTMVAIGTSASNLTSDGASSWTGSDVGTKQELSVTHTPDKAGPLTARVYVASLPGTSKSVFIDPWVYIT